MKKSITRHVPEDEALLELGKVAGQSMAFGTVAGRCSAAQAAALRQARNEKVHARFGLTWNQFCPKHLKMSGTQADEIIRLFHEFGPAYFENTQSVHISGDTYRAVAPFIVDQVLHFQGEVLELNSANVQKVARSVRESRRALPPPAEPAPEKPATVPTLFDRLQAYDRRVSELVAEFLEIAKDAEDAGTPLTVSSLDGEALIGWSDEAMRAPQENAVP
jgi:hypothetical protein